MSIFLGVFLFEVVLFLFCFVSLTRDCIVCPTYSTPLFDFLRCFPAFYLCPIFSSSIHPILLCDNIRCLH